MRIHILFALLFAFISCNSEEYEYTKPASNFTVETVLEDGTPVSVEVTYEQLACEYDFLYPDYVVTDGEGTAGITIDDGREYQFYCKSGTAKAYMCKTVRRADRRIKLILEE